MLQTITKHQNKEYPTPFMKTVKEALSVCRSSLDGVVILLNKMSSTFAFMPNSKTFD